jgi:hypothetical protein
MCQHQSILHTLLTWLPLSEISIEGTVLFYASGIIKNATEEPKRFYKMASRNVGNTFTAAGRSVYLFMGIM